MDYSQLRKKAFTTGLMLGVLSLVFEIAKVYIGGSTSMAGGSFIISFVIWAITVGLDIYFIADFRKSIGGFWTFKQAMGIIFVFVATQFVIKYVGYQIYAHFIDPAAVEQMKNATIAAKEASLETKGLSQEDIDKQMSMTKTIMDKMSSTSPAMILLSLCGGLVIEFIYTLILAAIFKKDPPLFMPDEAATEES